MVRVIGSKAGGRLGGRPYKVSRERYPQMVKQLRSYRAGLASIESADPGKMHAMVRHLHNHRGALQMDPDITAATRFAVTSSLDDVVAALQDGLKSGSGGGIVKVAKVAHGRVIVHISDLIAELERLIAELTALDAAREGAAE